MMRQAQAMLQLAEIKRERERLSSAVSAGGAGPDEVERLAYLDGVIAAAAEKGPEAAIEWVAYEGVLLSGMSFRVFRARGLPAPDFRDMDPNPLDGMLCALKPFDPKAALKFSGHRFSGHKS
jgi:hypothetical protein